MSRKPAPPPDIALVDDEVLVRTCFPLMHQLRPHLSSADEFVERWQSQARFGYRLAAQFCGVDPVGLTGFRIHENLVHGRHLYVDDLVADGAARGRGYGSRLVAYLIEAAKAEGCAKLLLDTPVANAGAHRFYYRQGLLITAFRFGLQVEPHSRKRSGGEVPA